MAFLISHGDYIFLWVKKQQINKIGQQPKKKLDF